MRRIALILLMLAPVCYAQNWTTVTASKITDGRSATHLLANGKLCFTATGDNGQTINFRVGGGGQNLNTPYCAWVKNGAIQGEFQIPNPQYTAPANIKYRIEVSDGASVIRRDPGVLITSDAFDYDAYVPTNVTLKTGQSVDDLGVGVLRFPDGTSQSTAGGSGSTPDATATNKGKVALAGDLGGTADAPTVPGLTAKADKDTVNTALASKESTDNRGQANGYASLGADGRVPAAQLPAQLTPSSNLADVASTATAKANLLGNTLGCLDGYDHPPCVVADTGLVNSTSITGVSNFAILVSAPTGAYQVCGELYMSATTATQGAFALYAKFSPGSWYNSGNGLTNVALLSSSVNANTATGYSAGCKPISHTSGGSVTDVSVWVNAIVTVNNTVSYYYRFTLTRVH